MLFTQSGACDAFLVKPREVHLVMGQKFKAVNLPDREVVERRCGRVVLQEEVVARWLVRLVVLEHAEAELQQAEVDTGIFCALIQFLFGLELVFMGCSDSLQAGELAVKGNKIALFDVPENVFELCRKVTVVDVHLISLLNNSEEFCYHTLQYLSILYLSLSIY